MNSPTFIAITTWLPHNHYVISNRCYVLRRFLRDQYIRGVSVWRHVYCFGDSWKTFIYFNLAFVLKWDARAAKLINYALSPRNINKQEVYTSGKRKLNEDDFYITFTHFKTLYVPNGLYFAVWQFKFLSI